MLLNSLAFFPTCIFYYIQLPFKKKNWFFSSSYSEHQGWKSNISLHNTEFKATYIPLANLFAHNHWHCQHNDDYCFAKNVKRYQMFSLPFSTHCLPTRNTFVSMFVNAILPLCPLCICISLLTRFSGRALVPAQGAASSVPWTQIMSDMPAVCPDKTDQLNSEWLDLSEPWVLLRRTDTWNLQCMQML